jgi:hypothetical protein
MLWMDLSVMSMYVLSGGPLEADMRVVFREMSEAVSRFHVLALTVWSAVVSVFPKCNNNIGQIAMTAYLS